MGVVVYGVGVRWYSVGVGRVNMSAGVYPIFVPVRNQYPALAHAPISGELYPVMEAVIMYRLPGRLAR